MDLKFTSIVEDHTMSPLALSIMTDASLLHKGKTVEATTGATRSAQ